LQEELYGKRKYENTIPQMRTLDKQEVRNLRELNKKRLQIISQTRTI
jgi:hypothetical protein